MNSLYLASGSVVIGDSNARRALRQLRSMGVIATQDGKTISGIVDGEKHRLSEFVVFVWGDN